MDMNKIHVNALSSTYNKFISNYELGKTNAQGSSFASVFANHIKNSANNTSGKVNTVDPISSKDLSMEEYKAYIYSEISSMQFNSTQSQYSYTICISDEAFDAMKNDPEYERFVMQTIKSSFSYYDPWHSETYIIMQFGKTKEDAKITCMSAPNKAFEQKSEESFWERRAERKKKMKELQERIAAQKHLQYKLREQAVMERRAIREMELKGIYGVEPQLPFIALPIEATLFLSMLGGNK